MKRGIFFFISALFLWGFFADVVFAGFGITPPYVRNHTLRPGSEYTQEIIVVRSDPVEDLNAELALNLPGIEHWFSFDRGLKFVLPKGESQVKFNVFVRVPDDAKLGPYKGNIRIRTYSSQGPTTGVSLALGAQIDVDLKVVEEIYDFAVRRVELSEAEEGYKKWWLDFPGKIKFAMHIENTGNVPSAPYQVTMEIYDPSGTQLLETTKNTNKIERLLPFATKKVYAYLPTRLPPGGYRVKYAIMKTQEDTAPASAGELSLSILPFGTITGYETYGFEGLSMGDKLSLVLPPTILILLAAIYLMFKPRRSRRVRSSPHHDPSYGNPPQVTPRRSVRVSTGVIDLSRKR